MTGGPNALDTLLLYVTAPGSGGRTKAWPCPRDLRFSTTAPGGFDALSVTLSWPDPKNPPLDVIRASAVCQVVDRRTGDVLWYGTLDDPGGAVTLGRTTFKITATGPRRILERVTRSYALCDRDLGNWVDMGLWAQSQPSRGDGSQFVAHSGDWPGDDPTGSIEFSFPDNSKLVTNTQIAVQYRPLLRSADAGRTNQKIVWLFWSHIATAAGGATHFTEMRVTGSTTVTVLSTPLSTTQVDESGAEGVGGWTITNAKSALVKILYTGAGGTRGSDLFDRVANVAVYFQVVDKNGNHLTPNGSVISLHAGGVMHDMLGRFLAGLVEVGVTVLYPTTPAIDQAAWWGGATAREIADFVQGVQPDYWWAVWEPGPSGLPRFEYRPWTIVGSPSSNSYRYYLTPRDATLKLAGSIDELYNRALVLYDRADGVPASLYVSGDIAELTYLGQTRTTTVDLTGRGPVNATTASSLGLQELSRVNQDRTSGTATVTGPVLDRVTGRTVMPWELLPGWLTKTSEPPDQVLAPPSFAASDGESQFRTTAVTFDAASGTAELTLDGGARSLFRRRRSPAKSATLPGGPSRAGSIPGAKARRKL